MRRGISLRVMLLLLLSAVMVVACSAPAGTPGTTGDGGSPAGAPGASNASTSGGGGAAASGDSVAALPAGAPAKLRIGIVTFLSGSAAAPFGVPSRNASELLIEQLNNGAGPAPYAMAGIGGVPIEAVYIDEAGGADKQVAEYRRLVLDEKVDLVIGYISSADCLAVTPVAEELKKLTVLFDCGTNRIFEEADRKYVFRTAAHQVIDSVGAARFVMKHKPDLKHLAGINQNYAWGQDSWNTFRDSVLKLKPDVQVVVEQFPKLGAGEYSAEISSLQSGRPDAIHSSFWGGDLESLIIQSAPRGLAEQSTLILPGADTILPRMPFYANADLVIGARGPHGALAPDNELNRWFKAAYTDRYSIRPVYPSYHMAQAILGVKVAYEKAMAANNGAWPSQEQVIAAFEHLEFDTPSGIIKMSLGKGHQAVEPMVLGVTDAFSQEKGEVDLVDVTIFPAECVNPPAGMTSQEWIEQGFQGADCP